MYNFVLGAWDRQTDGQTDRQQLLLMLLTLGSKHND